MSVPFHRRNSMGPTLFQCPITQEVMENPVILMGDGQTYEEEPLKTWLADHDRSPSTGAPLTSKEYCSNWALKRIIQDWQRNHASEKLRAAQMQRLENFFKPDGPFAKYFDITIYAGNDRERFRCVRGMLGSLSQFWGDLLFSEEGTQKDEFEIPNMSPQGFEQVLRVAYHLDPEIDTDNVMEVLAASNICGVGMLKDECLAHLSMHISIPKVAENVMMALEPDNDYGIDARLRDEFIGLLLNRPLDGSNVMTVFNSAYALRMLTSELERKCCKIFTSQSDEVANSSAFVYTRLELMQALVECDYFNVNEETLWRRVVAWASTQAELEGSDPNYRPIGLEDAKEMEMPGLTPGGPDGAPIPVGGVLGMLLMQDELKEREVSSALSNEFPDAGKKYLQQMIPHFRFPLMNPEFFVDNVAPLLPREMSDNVLQHHVLPSKKKCMFSKKRRIDITGSGQGSSFEVVAAHPAMERAKNIPDPATRAEWSRVSMNNAGGKQWFVIDCNDAVKLLKFDWKNYYNDDDTIQTVHLECLPTSVDFTEELAGGDEHWNRFQTITIVKTTDWQTHNVTQPTEHPRIRYFRWVVTDVYGSNDRYTCLDHLKIHCEREGWSTNFANKVEPDAAESAA